MVTIKKVKSQNVPVATKDKVEGKAQRQIHSKVQEEQTQKKEIKNCQRNITVKAQHF